MKRISFLICLLFIIGGIAPVSPVYSSDTQDSHAQQYKSGNLPSAGGPRLGPPPEAYAACKTKKVGDTASFVNPRGETVTGKCELEGKQLVLRPDHPKGKSGGKQHGPPPEAYQACLGKSARSVAQFVNPRGETVKGTCAEENGKMVLRPYSNKGNKSTKTN